MRLRLFSFRSLRDLFYAVILILTGSALIAYNLCRYLPIQQQKRVGAKRGAVYTKQESPEQLKIVEGVEWEIFGRRVLEGIYHRDEKIDDDDLEGSLNKSRNEIDINIPRTQSQNDDQVTTIHSNSSVASENGDVQADIDHSHVNLKTDRTNQRCDDSSCTDDLTTLPYLLCIYTEPSIEFSPTFNGSTSMEYYATVSHNVVLIQVEAFAQNCRAEVRLSSKNGPNRNSNYTLGVGLNRIHLLVILRSTNSLTAADPCSTGSTCVLNTYTLHIYRQRAGENLRDTDIRQQPHQMCYLQQNCGLPFLQNESCGLQISGHSNWNSFRSFRRRLKPCTTGTEQGVWLLPCSSCNDSSSCYWKEAIWQPHDCKHLRLNREDLRVCLAGKKILFVGDSTNRGIMHYLMEQANGSLTEWDRTHDTKVYANLNRMRTTVSFAYYPQFWVAAEQRPMFDETLFQLLKMTQPLENSHETVLVVGGVHWLAIQHLNTIANMLKNENLSKIKVIIKTLGAGFHQRIDGLHHLTLTEQQRLVLHNAALVDQAVSLGFQVIETFNMTMARYTDFLQGKCACHFHRVKEILPSFTQYIRSSTRDGHDKLLDMPIHYHVEGDVNAVYSEIVFNRICGTDGA